MKTKTIYQKQDDPILKETTEPIIIWSLHFNSEVLYMPEFYLLIETTYFPS